MKFVCVLLLFFIIRVNSDFNTIVCETGSVDIGCRNSNEKIEIISAYYGRSSRDICPSFRDYNPYQCSEENVTTRVKNLCHNNKLCNFEVNNGVFKMDPCPNIAKYLKLHWECAANNFENVRPYDCKSNSQHSLFLCQEERKMLQCADNEDIVIGQATVGRDNLQDDDGDGGKCKLGRYNEDYCPFTDVTNYVQEEMCRNNTCDVTYVVNKFPDYCLGVYKYLKLKFYCCPRYRNSK